jgi:hypothetical protein
MKFSLLALLLVKVLGGTSFDLFVSAETVSVDNTGFGQVLQRYSYYSQL